MAFESLSSIQLAEDGREAIFRIRGECRRKLEKHLFQRYPHREWGAFFRFGWRRTSWGVAISYVEPILPEVGDLDRQTSLTTFCDQYSSRALRIAANADNLAVGVIHSHPSGYGTFPSPLDDDMDRYFARELSAYTENSPYASIIFQRSEDSGFTFSGRVYDRGQWLPVSTLLTVGTTRLDRDRSELLPTPQYVAPTSLFEESTTARLESIFGEQSAKRLRSSVVGVIGCSGTGSPAVEVLARAGVGEVVVVDPQRLSPSNVERVHGSTYSQLRREPLPYKVEIMREMIAAIDPSIKVTALVGNILHANVVDELLRCDLLVGTVDSNHGRVALSDLAHHFLIPSLDVGIGMAGKNGKVTEQIVELAKFSPELACVFCRGRVDSVALAQELMTDEERKLRMVEANQASLRGDNPDQYWRFGQQLHTVGYLTTAGGAMTAGYAEGWLTGAFEMPHASLQFDTGREKFGCVAPPVSRLPTCGCQSHLGWGESANPFKNISLPAHWSKRAILLQRGRIGEVA